MLDYLEIIFWKIALKILKKGYGYCWERDGGKFRGKNRCSGCDGSDVQDWISDHIDLIKWWRKEI